jgi:drug/metabolite transporter (DMT)-like permease
MWKGILLVLGGACSFGVLSSIVRAGYGYGYTLAELCGMQAGIGMLILWAVHFLSGRNMVSLKDRSARTAFLLGSATGLTSITYYHSVKYIPASVAIILLMQFTWMSMVGEMILYKKRPTLIQLIAVVLILGGTLLASGLFGSNAITLRWEGIVFGLLAALCYTIFIMVTGKAGPSLTPVLKSAWMITGAFLLICCLYPPVYLFNGRFTHSNLWLWGLPLAVFGTVLPPLLFSKGMPKTGVPLGAILSAAELPVAVITAMILLNESVTWLQVLGIIIILLAIVAVNLRRKQQAS